MNNQEISNVIDSLVKARNLMRSMNSEDFRNLIKIQEEFNNYPKTVLELKSEVNLKLCGIDLHDFEKRGRASDYVCSGGSGIPETPFIYITTDTYFCPMCAKVKEIKGEEYRSYKNVL